MQITEVTKNRRLGWNKGDSFENRNRLFRSLLSRHHSSDQPTLCEINEIWDHPQYQRMWCKVVFPIKVKPGEPKIKLGELKLRPSLYRLAFIAK